MKEFKKFISDAVELAFMAFLVGIGFTAGAVLVLCSTGWLHF